MNDSIIINGMSELKKNYIAVELNKIYSEIFEKVRTASADTFANLFTTLEAKMITNFFIEFDDKMRLTSYEVMKNAGVPENDIPRVWIRTRNNVPSPQAKFCNQGNYTAPKTAAAQTVSRKTVQENAPHAPELGKWILISGAVLEVLSWIFIPSYNLWAPVVRGIGLVIIGVGAYKTYQEIKSPAARIPLTPEAEKHEQEKAMENVKEICAKQFELNYGIYCEWLDKIAADIAKECAVY